MRAQPGDLQFVPLPVPYVKEQEGNGLPRQTPSLCCLLCFDTITVIGVIAVRRRRHPGKVNFHPDRSERPARNFALILLSSIGHVTIVLI